MVSSFSVPTDAKPLKVSEVTSAVKEELESRFASLWVEGEISNLARPNSGHLYFTLKDSQSQLKSVMYRGMALRLRFDLRDGLEVFARGRVSVYVPRGEYQLIVEELQPKGIGALELAFQQLKEKLFVKGYFDPRRKRPLPRFPKTIALVTSPTGAAVRDMLEILGQRWPLAQVLVCPVRVQGEGSAQEIAAMIRQLNQIKDFSVDVMIVGRGGGSLEDLWSFNEEIVANAIYESRIPVVSAVGHEIDLTIADLVADYRGLTPSQAATALTPDQQELLVSLQATAKQFQDALQYRLQLAQQRLEALVARRSFRFPLERIREQERKLDELAERMHRSVLLQVDRFRQQMVALAHRLETLSPLNVLKRGYTLTSRTTLAQLVRSASDLTAGEQIETRFPDGRVLSRVDTIDLNSSSPPMNGSVRVHG